MCKVLHVFIFVLVINVLNLCCAKILSKNDDEIIVKKFFEADKNLKQWTGSTIKRFLPYVMEANEHLNLSSNCRENIFRWVSDLRKLKLSAIKILDATSKFPEALLTGRLYFPGDVEECLASSVTDGNGKEVYRGQYCLLSGTSSLLPPTRKKSTSIFSGDTELLKEIKNSSEFMQFVASKIQIFYIGQARFGICLPSGCDEDDIGQLLDLLGDKIYVNFTVLDCDDKPFKPLSLRTIIAISFLSCLAFIVLIGTAVDYVAAKRNITIKGIGIKLLLCFSLLTNFPKLIDTKNQSALSCLNGIRCLSLFHTILVHQYMIASIALHLTHAFDTIEDIKTYHLQVILNGILTTEVFFFIGGLVNCYTRMKINEVAKFRINGFQLFFLRLWRMFPAMYFVTLFGQVVFENMRGPVTIFKKDLVTNCEKNWWQNVLFINNYFDLGEACMGHTWYVAADMQLFIVSLFTIPYFFRNPKKATLLHMAIIFLGLSFTIGWVFYKNALPAIIVHRADITDIFRFRNAFITTPPHIAPYFIGILAGYFLHAKNKVHISKVWQVTGWICATFISLSMLLLTQRWNAGVEYSKLEGSAYFAFSRALYVLGPAWIVICCSTGHGGIVNYILSLPLWIPIARLSYMMYLVSLLVQGFYVANSRIVGDSYRMTIIWQYFGDLTVTFLSSLVLTLIIEAPCISIDRVFIRKRHKTSETEDKKFDNQDAEAYKIQETTITENN